MKKLSRAYRHQQHLLANTPSPVLFDVGANEGKTLHRYSKMFPSGRLYGFEPLPELAEQLRKQFAKKPQVTVVGSAMSEESGTGRFHVNPASVQSSLLPITKAGQRSYMPHAKDIDVELVSLDDYCQRHEITQVDLLKLDIQGGELLALRGAERMLRAGRVAVLFLEAWFARYYQGAPLFYDLAEHLRQFDYSLFGIYKLKRDSNEQLVKVDVLFVSPHVQARLDGQRPHWYSRGYRRASGLEDG